MDALLIVNAGSSSVKFPIFDASGGAALQKVVPLRRLRVPLPADRR